MVALIAACGEVKSMPDVDAPPALDGPGSPDTPPLIDAPPSGPNFDVAYTSQWEIRNTTGVGAGAVGLIINKSNNQLMDLSQLAVADITDDHPAITFGFSILNPAVYMLPPQQAGGNMSPGASTFVNPFVSEPRFDTNRPTFDFTLTAIPAGTTATVNASAKVRHRDQQVTLNFRFNVVGSGASGATIQAASRVSSGGF